MDRWSFAFFVSAVRFPWVFDFGLQLARSQLKFRLLWSSHESKCSREESLPADLNLELQELHSSDLSFPSELLCTQSNRDVGAERWSICVPARCYDSGRIGADAHVWLQEMAVGAGWRRGVQDSMFEEADRRHLFAGAFRWKRELHHLFACSPKLLGPNANCAW